LVTKVSNRARVALTSIASQESLVGGSRGFTLIEVMVALVITLIGLRVLFGGVVGSLHTASSTATWDRVISSAESRLASIADPALVLGERQGDDGDGYRWRTRVTFLGAAPAPRAERPGPWSHGTGLYAVSVTIFWGQGGGEHSFELDSARLGFLPGSGSAP
jgi:prepilin-type N-terminal cleavage/methylation domain-containing protein